MEAWWVRSGACEAMDGRTRAHMDVLVASPDWTHHAPIARFGALRHNSLQTVCLSPSLVNSIMQTILI